MARSRSSADRVAALRAKLPPATHRHVGDSFHPKPGGGFVRVRQRFGQVRKVNIKTLPAYAKPVKQDGGGDGD